MKTPFIYISLLAIQLLDFACKKNYLDTKPLSSLIQPTTIHDFEQLLENPNINFSTAALPLLASDDYYYTSYAGWEAARTSIERSSYIWAKDVYGGQVNIQDWNIPYQDIFYANSVLDGLAGVNDSSSSPDYNFTKGWALFIRAYEMYDLVKNYSAAYDSSTSGSDLGVPLKLHSGIDQIVGRSTTQQTYNQIINDLHLALLLLPDNYPLTHLNHPSKISAFALFARIYLSMRDYSNALLYSDSCLRRYNSLIDYNSLDTTSNFPFPIQNIESLYATVQVPEYSSTIAYYFGQGLSIDTTLISSYDSNDLRRYVFFTSVSPGQFIIKGGYFGNGAFPFSGLAVDEIYLIRAECYARSGNISASQADLNSLLNTRYMAGTFVSYVTTSQTLLLQKILLERRKELVYRGLRWSDLKRLNKEGANITLTRVLNGQQYTLPPNDPRYLFNIPQDEISLSGIQQNQR